MDKQNNESPESQRGIRFRTAFGIFIVVAVVTNTLLEAAGEKHGLAREIATEWFGFSDYTSTESTAVSESTRQVTETHVLISKEFQAGVVLGAGIGVLVAGLYRFLTRARN